jgi:1,6-anhydro-N-acetylmuramate kinase
MRRIAGAHAVIVTDADPACIDALYRHATLFIDASLRSRGLARIVRAARAGAIPLAFAEAAAARLLPPECTIARSGIVDLRDAVQRVWHAPGRDAIGRRVQATLGATLGSETSVAGAVQRFADALVALAGATVRT